MANKLDVDNIINSMIHSGGKNVKMKEKDISTLCKVAREIFMEQPVFLELEAPIKICGKLKLILTSDRALSCTGVTSIRVL